MEAFVSCLLAILAGLLVVPVAVFCLEIVAAITLPQRECAVLPSPGFRRRVVVLVPAHNESTELLPTLADIKRQVLRGERVLVVADNCTDDTAAVVLAADAQVVERHDRAKLGKGYALDVGLQCLSSDPPQILIVVDADCRLGENAIDQLAT